MNSYIPHKSFSAVTNYPTLRQKLDLQALRLHSYTNKAQRSCNHMHSVTFFTALAARLWAFLAQSSSYQTVMSQHCCSRSSSLHISWSVSCIFHGASLLLLAAKANICILHTPFLHITHLPCFATENQSTNWQSGKQNVTIFLNILLSKQKKQKTEKNLSTYWWKNPSKTVVSTAVRDRMFFVHFSTSFMMFWYYFTNISRKLAEQYTRIFPDP